MAFNQENLKPLQPQNSANDDVAFAQEDDFGDDIKTNLTAKVVDEDGNETGGDFYGQKLLVTESSIVRNSPKTEFVYKTGNAASTKMTSGPQGVEGSLTSLVATEGSAIILQMITQDKTPAERWLSQDITVTQTVAENQDLTGTIGLDGGGSSKTLTPPAKLTVKITGGSLSGATGTITFVGTDADDVSQTEFLTFHNATLGVAQTTASAYKTITAITPAGFSGGTVSVTVESVSTGDGPGPEVTFASALDVATDGRVAMMMENHRVANPVRIKVTPQTGSAIDEGELRATIVIYGTDIKGRSINERLSFQGSGVPAAKTTQRFFRSVSHAVVRHWAAGSTLNASVKDTAVEVTFQPQDQGLFIFLQMLSNKGLLPAIYKSLIATNLSLSVDRNNVLSMSMNFTGREALPRHDTQGRTGDEAQPHDLSALKTAEALIYHGMHARTEVSGVLVPFINQTLTIDQTLSPSGVQAGTPFEEMRPYRSSKRGVMVDGTIAMTKENNLVDAFIENETLEDVRFIVEHDDLGSFGWKLECIMETAELSTDADPTSPNFDRYTQTCNIKAFDNESGAPSDFKFVVTYADYDRVRQYD